MDYGARGTVNARDNLATYRELVKDLDRKRQAAFDRLERPNTLDILDAPRVTAAERAEAIRLAGAMWDASVPERDAGAIRYANGERHRELSDCPPDGLGPKA